MSLFNLVLQSNELADCSTNVRTQSGNAYGGGISVYMGGYASVRNSGNAKAAVGETVVRNAIVVMESTRFTEDHFPFILARMRGVSVQTPTAAAHVERRQRVV